MINNRNVVSSSAKKLNFKLEKERDNYLIWLDTMAGWLGFPKSLWRDISGFVIVSGILLLIFGIRVSENIPAIGFILLVIGFLMNIGNS